MKSLLTLLTVVALSGSAFAGSYGYKNPKAPVLPPPPPAGCDAFGPGLAFGAFGGALLGDTDDVLGGGILAEYAFSEYFAVQGSYGLYATESEHHNFDAALVLRYPITSICLAPYALVGGGFATNAENVGHFFVGGGVDWRIPTASNLSVFADAAYYFADRDYGDDNSTIVRLGVKMPF